MTQSTDELEKLLKAGTPTPWFVGGVRFKMNGGDWHGVMSYNEAKKQDDNVCCVGYDPRTGEGHADARLICAAVNALPELLAMAEENARMRAALQAIVDNAEIGEREADAAFARAALSKTGAA
jgi:cell division protein ZapA (FtsZ GTPase activity inhibitor)